MTGDDSENATDDTSTPPEEESPTTLFAPDDPEAPPLVLSSVEPGPVPSAGAEALSDPAALDTLHKLAGVAADPEAARVALRAALAGEPYDRQKLPDPRAMLVGIARVLVRSGTDADALTAAVVDAMNE